ncbi:2-amino-4-hydroxy-6-hydroxymethyldihydropteridine diphosphokinase [Pantoea sp. SoEX]|uniref:2-amino-4-hydroxy-6- hydroxymethyldihydropteridine diphosphokinase n=1 Tax=Pantoea sp. SoEX TaxID=2576763 RepID=UPI001359A7FA|nr:2-amino-4-hydroxy-6-hydroxymethyldihydropteridine diphosphokinase [Pantoea sp. SoEX]MXP51162.1 2-amino-4-hydroxy-6-hydroxymethyldihydropteridine diphosphokinase [Pantoea sp. SoEX]
MTIVYLALGSNINNPIYQIKSALAELDKIPQTKRIVTSKFYLTQPYGFKNQPNFINIVVSMHTNLSPEILLKFIQNIERMQGRIRDNNLHWGPRNIDIDIILFGNLMINSNCLTIPHYDMINRAFMLIPLVQIAPNITLPNGESIKNILDKLDISTVKILNI